MDLGVAFRQKDSKSIIEWLNSGYDVNADPQEVLLNAAHYGTPIVASAAGGKVDQLKFLIQHGAKLDGALIAAVR